MAKTNVTQSWRLSCSLKQGCPNPMIGALTRELTAARIRTDLFQVVEASPGEQQRCCRRPCTQMPQKRRLSFWDDVARYHWRAIAGASGCLHKSVLNFSKHMRRLLESSRVAATARNLGTLAYRTHISRSLLRSAPNDEDCLSPDVACEIFASLPYVTVLWKARHLRFCPVQSF